MKPMPDQRLQNQSLAEVVVLEAVSFQDHVRTSGSNSLTIHDCLEPCHLMSQGIDEDFLELIFFKI